MYEDCKTIKKVWMGIDPGKDGFISVLDSKGCHFFQEMPKIGGQVDIKRLSDYIDCFAQSTLFCKVHVVIEDVHAIFGASSKSTFTFGYITGIIEALLVANNISYTKVTPKAWQKEMWQGIPIQTKPSSTGKTKVNDTKSMSLQAATRLFPKIDLRKNLSCHVPCEDKVDSLLLAEYCRRKF